MLNGCTELFGVQDPRHLEGVGNGLDLFSVRVDERHAARIEDLEFGFDEVAKVWVFQELKSA